ncbi:MAG: DNA repair protein RecO [Olsenella sp.]
MRRTLHTKAIVLDTVKLKEQDLILTMIGEDGQKRRAVAKGARKPGGRFASRCDILCESDLLLSAGRGPLPILSEASLVNAHAPLREDLDSLSAASAAAELAEKSSYEDMPDPFLFKILSALLSSLEGADAPHQMVLVSAYAFKVLAHEGWKPELESCIACGDPHPTLFSAAAGGALCASCAREVAGAHELTENDFAWMRALLAATFKELKDAPIDAATARLLLMLAHEWGQTHLDCRLKAWEFWRGL